MAWSCFKENGFRQFNVYKLRSQKSINSTTSKYFQNKIITCKNQIKEFKQKEASSSLDLKQLEHIINNFIHQDQYRLRIELERQRQMLKFNAQDHQLVDTFYPLNPRQTEVYLNILEYFLINFDLL